MKRILAFFLALLLLAQAPVVFAQEPLKQETTQNEEPEIIITVVNSTTLRVQHAPVGSTMEIYNVLGVKEVTEKIDSSDKTITINLSNGYYIVKIGTVVRKIVIK